MELAGVFICTLVAGLVCGGFILSSCVFLGGVVMHTLAMWLCYQTSLLLYVCTACKHLGGANK